MKRNITIIISALVLVFTVPWFFTGSSEEIIFGFPTWAFYSIALTFFYSVMLSILIGKSWKEMEE